MKSTGPIAAEETGRWAGAVSALTPMVCWTRMQAESGQSLDDIVARKELERRAGDGLFCWGVGNAPATVSSTLAKMRADVDVVFSVMKSRPKAQDVAPEQVLLWRRYVDASGMLRDLPGNVLVTSRAETASGLKRSHYALMAYSSAPLELGDFGAFDPDAFRNVGGAGGQIGSSQVTALLRRVAPSRTDSGYRINLKAKLTEGYWVRLSHPILLDGAARTRIDTLRPHQVGPREWRGLIAELRASSGDSEGDQLVLI